LEDFKSFWNFGHEKYIDKIISKKERFCMNLFS
jgi:hypothetical protein